MKLLLVLVLSAVIATLLSEDLRLMYKQTQEKYNMHVLSSSPLEEKKHFHDFCDFAEAVQKHNEEDPSGFKAEVNMFALMPKAERYEKWTGLNASQIMEEQRRALSKRSGIILPVKRQSDTAVDYSDKLPPVKNQGGCGSCWAFGAVVALEYQVNRNSKNIKSLSEQQYLDCVYEGKRDGCRGGWPTDCYAWTRNNGNMIARESDYTYQQRDGKCRSAADGVQTGIKGYSVNGFQYLAKGDANMLSAVAKPDIGVISVAFGVIDSFFGYRGGVYSATGCSAINHALDVVGYGKTSGKDFWQVRNSWGGNWGEGGYVKILRGPNTCAISNYGHYPLVSGSDADDGDDGNDGDDKSDGDDDEEKKTCRWVIREDQKMKQKIQGLPKMSMEDAKKSCESKKECNAITCKTNNNCWLNKKPKGKSNTKFNGFIKKCR